MSTLRSVLEKCKEKYRLPLKDWNTTITFYNCLSVSTDLSKKAGEWQTVQVFDRLIVEQLYAGIHSVYIGIYKPVQVLYHLR